MVIRTKTVLGLWFVSACLAGGAAEGADTNDVEGSTSKDPNAPYPLDYFAMRPVLGNARLSPDGKHLALLKIPSKAGNPILEVYASSDLAQDPFRMDADPMEITGFNWVSDTDIAFSARQQVRRRIEGFNRGTYEFKFGAVNVETGKVKAFEQLGLSLEHLLPNSPTKVIVSLVEGGTEGRVNRAFRPRAYYEMDLKRGSRKLLIRGKMSLGNISFDGEGNPWLARGYDNGKRELIWYWRPPDSKDWVEFNRQHEDEFEFYPFQVVGKDPDVAGHALVVARNGEDTEGLWSFDLANKTFGELVMRHPRVDIGSVSYHSNSWSKPNTVVAVGYVTDKVHMVYLDAEEEALHKQLEELIPNAHNVDVLSRSRDGATLLITNNGPRNPGTYYLIKDNKITKVGARQPLLEYERLAPVEFVRFEARDGTSIPAYITTPHGEPPFPLVVMPHGGPAARDYLYGPYDEWAQVLANNGYLVMQPQFRGSTGFGLALAKGAYEDGGQEGHKMQDDKDDAAMYLVERGLADPDRMAMYGWSYGGYAALVAASRTPQIYQCVIAGAAVADPMMQINYYRFQFRGAFRDRLVRLRETAIQPVDEVEKVNVPMLIVHGDVDQRVPVDHAKKYLKELDEHGKDYKYVELAGADHFSNTLFYEHKSELYSSMIDYLANDCGPGGL